MDNEYERTISALEQETRSIREELRAVTSNLQDRLAEINLFRLVTETTSKAATARDPLKFILKNVIKMLGAENGSIMLLDPVRNRLTVRAASGTKDAHPSQPVFGPGEGIAGWVAAQGKAVLVNDTSKDARYVKMARDRGQINSILCFPLWIEGEIIGVLNASHSEPNTFTTDSERILEVISGQIAVAIQNARLIEESQELSEAKSRLIRAISHELRTPLTPIKTFAEMLLHSKRPINDAIREKYLRTIDQQCDRLAAMISDILKYQELISDPFPGRVEQVPLEQVVSTSMEALNDAAEQGKLSLTHRVEPELPPVIGSRERLKQVMQNLLRNAISFTDEGGSIEVTAVQDHDTVHVTVQDTGIGITPEEHGKIFDEFYHSKRKEVRDRTGTGLGLTMCREIILKHGGCIWAEHKQGKGTALHFVLPIARDR